MNMGDSNESSNAHQREGVGDVWSWAALMRQVLEAKYLMHHHLFRAHMQMQTCVHAFHFIWMLFSEKVVIKVRYYDVYYIRVCFEMELRRRKTGSSVSNQQMICIN